MHTAQRAEFVTPYLKLLDKTTQPNQFVFLIPLNFFARFACVGMIWRILPNWFVFLIPFHSFRRFPCVGITEIFPSDLFFIPFLSFRKIACEGVTQIHPTDLAFHILCLELQLCKPHLVAEATSPDLRIFANIQECDYERKGQMYFSIVAQTKLHRDYHHRVKTLVNSGDC